MQALPALVTSFAWVIRCWLPSKEVLAMGREV